MTSETEEMRKKALAALQANALYTRRNPNRALPEETVEETVKSKKASLKPKNVLYKRRKKRN